MNIDIDEVLKVGENLYLKIDTERYRQSLLHINAVEIAARIRAKTKFKPMSEAELCSYFRRNGFGNTVIISYMLSKFCRRSTRDYLWDRDTFGRFYPANAHWRD